MRARRFRRWTIVSTHAQSFKMCGTPLRRFGFENRTLSAYNGVLYASSVAAARAMASAVGDASVASFCDDLLDRSRQALQRLFFAPEAGLHGHFRAWWDEGAAHPINALHVDTLYGQLWAFVLGLEAVIGNSEMEKHLASEREISSSPGRGGFLVMFNYSGRGERDAIRDNHVSVAILALAPNAPLPCFEWMRENL